MSRVTEVFLVEHRGLQTLTLVPQSALLIGNIMDISEQVTPALVLKDGRG